MRRFTFALLACFLALLIVGPVAACINDSELDRSEREFKSTYNEQSPKKEASPSTPSTWDQIGPIARYGAGSALLIGACVVCLRRPGRTD